MTRSAKAVRRDDRKRRRDSERRLAALRDTLGLFLFLTAAASVALAGCLAGAGLPWCAIPPVAGEVLVSAVVGLTLGATIRFVRERRKLQQRDR